MKTKAVRLHGEMDLRLSEFELPPIAEDEILAHVVSDSICMSSYKAAKQGSAHKRVPADIAENPVIIGHEFCGEIVEVGSKWKDQYKAGEKFIIQPALNYNGTLWSPGYSYKYIGGDATYIIIPREVMELGCLLPYSGDAYFYGSLAEPMSCIVGAFHASYHTTNGSYEHAMGIKDGGAMAILAGAGPMGMGAIDYALHAERRPSLLIVTDIDDARLGRAASLLTAEDAKAHGVELRYVNTANMTDAVAELKALTPNGEGFDDIFVLAPVKSVVEMADAMLARDGCLNFFAGPTDNKFSATFNFYRVHYESTHLIGTSGGNTDDMRESIVMMESGAINPASMITHIGGLDAVAETTLHLPDIKGAKKLIYTNISLPLIAIDSFGEAAEKYRAAGDDKNAGMFNELDRLCRGSNGLWNAAAEKYLLANAESI